MLGTGNFLCAQLFEFINGKDRMRVHDETTHHPTRCAWTKLAGVSMAHLARDEKNGEEKEMRKIASCNPWTWDGAGVKRESLASRRRLTEYLERIRAEWRCYLGLLFLVVSCQ